MKKKTELQPEFLRACDRHYDPPLHYYRGEDGLIRVAEKRVACQCVENDVIQIHTVTACAGCGLGERPRNMRYMADSDDKLYCIDCFAAVVNAALEGELADDALKDAWGDATYYGGFAGVKDDSAYSWAFREAGGATYDKDWQYIAGCLCAMMGYGEPS